MTITQNHVVEFLALATSVACYNSLKKGSLRWLPFFLLFILLVELTGNYFRSVPYANTRLYNFTIPIEYLFYIFLFWLHGNKYLKIFCRYAAILLIGITVFEFFRLPLIALHRNTLLTGQTAIIICFCIYLYGEFVTAKEETLLKNYFFWMAAGLFLFNLGDFSYFFLFPVIAANNWDKTNALFKAVNHNLLLLLYLSYMIAILIHKKYL